MGGLQNIIGLLMSLGKLKIWRESKSQERGEVGRNLDGEHVEIWQAFHLNYGPFSCEEVKCITWILILRNWRVRDVNLPNTIQCRKRFARISYSSPVVYLSFYFMPYMYNVLNNSIQILPYLTLNHPHWMEDIFNRSNRQNISLWGMYSVD